MASPILGKREWDRNGKVGMEMTNEKWKMPDEEYNVNIQVKFSSDASLPQCWTPVPLKRLKLCNRAIN